MDENMECLLGDQLERELKQTFNEFRRNQQTALKGSEAPR
jgi:hypothetical protein